MSTPPGIALVTDANRDLGRNTALEPADPPHERGDAARNRALLLDAARRLIAARGPDAVTMDEIATAAGVGKGTLFRRFGGRGFRPSVRGHHLKVALPVTPCVVFLRAVPRSALMPSAGTALTHCRAPRRVVLRV